MARRLGPTVRRRPPARIPLPSTDPAVQTVLAAAPLSTAQRTAIQQRYGARVTATLPSQPYCLLQDIAGLSFPTVDTLARKLGIGKAHLARLYAGILAVLQHAIRQGRLTHAHRDPPRHPAARRPLPARGRVLFTHISPCRNVINNRCARLI